MQTNLKTLNLIHLTYKLEFLFANISAYICECDLSICEPYFLNILSQVCKCSTNFTFHKTFFLHLQIAFCEYKLGYELMFANI